MSHGSCIYLTIYQLKKYEIQVTLYIVITYWSQ